ALAGKHAVGSGQKPSFAVGRIAELSLTVHGEPIEPVCCTAASGSGVAELSLLQAGNDSTRIQPQRINPILCIKASIGFEPRIATPTPPPMRGASCHART